MARELWKGNEAIAEAAIRSGCKYFFGYPITPQNEIPEYMSMRLPQVGGCFLQAESEISAINMVYGASGSGVRVMTSSSSPGISLKQEGITYMIGAELPALIVNVMRGGPGLGGIQPSQADYFQATRGGGNGDYRMIVLAPNTIQEAVDLTQLAFDLADQYRNPTMLLADGMIGQMMEPIEWKETPKRNLPAKTWATDGHKGKREHNVINSLFLEATKLEEHNYKLYDKYNAIQENEVMYDEYKIDGAELVFVAYGTPSRIVKKAIEILEKEGIKAGLFRPITLWPYPSKRLKEIAAKSNVAAFLTVEMSMGQMIEDVQIAVQGVKPVGFVGTPGGIIPTPMQIAEEARKVLGGAK